MTRFTFKDIDPGIYQALAAVETEVREAHAFSDMEKKLMKIRASQINGCAYCINMHVELALKAGDSVKRISLLAAWSETDIFTEAERVLLAMTEEITRCGLSDATYAAALAAFGPARTAWAIMAIISINNWNRMLIAGHMPIQ